MRLNGTNHFKLLDSTVFALVLRTAKLWFRDNPSDELIQDKYIMFY